MLAIQLSSGSSSWRTSESRAHKRIADEIRVLDDELQVLEVIGGERGNIDARLGEIDAFFGAEFFAFGTRLRDFDGNGIRIHWRGSHHRFSRRRTRRARPALAWSSISGSETPIWAGAMKLSRLVVAGRVAHLVPPAQDQRIALLREAASAGSREVCRCEFVHLATPPSPDFVRVIRAEFQSRHEIDRLPRLGPTALSAEPEKRAEMRCALRASRRRILSPGAEILEEAACKWNAGCARDRERVGVCPPE